MPISFPSSPSLGQNYPYNGKVWRWMGGRWSAVSQFPHGASVGSETFRIAVSQQWRETLVTTATTSVKNMNGVLLTYL